jgi:hypothetical protein
MWCVHLLEISESAYLNFFAAKDTVDDPAEPWECMRVFVLIQTLLWLRGGTK